MAIWLGEAGGIRLAGPSSERIYTRIEPGDVEASINRFTFEDTRLSLITGDRVWIRRVDENDNLAGKLDFVSASGWEGNAQYPDGEWFVNVDGMGGIHLYKTWEDAVNNNKSASISLSSISAGYRVTYEIVEGNEKCLAQTVGWTLNTDRDVADFTSLGDSFKQQMSTLVSGSGELDCFFDYAPRLCGNENEMPSIFLHRLALRQEIGANFIGVFLLKQVNAIPLTEFISQSEREKQLFYYTQCVVTGVATELAPDQPIHSKITFVTTGPIRLFFDFASSYLLQEQPPNDKVLTESGFGVLLETPE